MRALRSSLLSLLIFQSSMVVGTAGSDVQGTDGVCPTKTAASATAEPNHWQVVDEGDDNNNKQKVHGGEVQSSLFRPSWVLAPRGGGWYFGKKTAGRKYKEMLLQQVYLMDKQLGQAHEELALLRKQLATSNSLLHKVGPAGSSSKQAVQKQSTKLKAILEAAELRKQVASLKKEVTQLEKMRGDLQILLDQQAAKIEELQTLLLNSQEDKVKLKEHYEKQMEQMMQELEQKSQRQVDELRNIMEARVAEAAKQARKAALLEMEQKIEAATLKVQDMANRALKEERRRADTAVEKEKVKMRKLAKALYEREKQLNSLEKEPGFRVIRSAIPGGKAGTSNHKVDSLRNPLK